MFIYFLDKVSLCSSLASRVASVTTRVAGVSTHSLISLPYLLAASPTLVIVLNKRQNITRWDESLLKVSLQGFWTINKSARGGDGGEGSRTPLG